jgi:hypothetical protein
MRNHLLGDYPLHTRYGKKQSRILSLFESITPTATINYKPRDGHKTVEKPLRCRNCRL